MSDSQTVYIIQLRHWGYDDERYYPEFMETVKAFRTRQSAEAERRKLERQEQTQSHIPNSNPFYELSETFSDVTSSSEAQLFEKIVAANIPAPSAEENHFGTKYDWGEWWETLANEQQTVVRPWFDKISMYTIVEVPLDSLNVINEGQ